MDHLIGKRISVQIQDRDKLGKTNNELINVVGICTFIGENKLLGWPLQVTIGRTPYEIKYINNIKVW